MHDGLSIKLEISEKIRSHKFFPRFLVIGSSHEIREVKAQLGVESVCLIPISVKDVDISTVKFVGNAQKS
jgi:hypothetical protein